MRERIVKVLVLVPVKVTAAPVMFSILFVFVPMVTVGELSIVKLTGAVGARVMLSWKLTAVPTL